MLAIRSVNEVKPPETNVVHAPCARIVATSVRAPEARVMRVSMTLPTTE